MNTYVAMAEFAQTGVLVYSSLFFLAALAYACWPSNGKRFSEAAHIPLRED